MDEELREEGVKEKEDIFDAFSPPFHPSWSFEFNYGGVSWCCL